MYPTRSQSTSAPLVEHLCCRSSSSCRRQFSSQTLAYEEIRNVTQLWSAVLCGGLRICAQASDVNKHLMKLRRIVSYVLQPHGELVPTDLGVQDSTRAWLGSF